MVLIRANPERAGSNPPGTGPSAYRPPARQGPHLLRPAPAGSHRRCRDANPSTGPASNPNPPPSRIPPVAFPKKASWVGFRTRRPLMLNRLVSLTPSITSRWPSPPDRSVVNEALGEPSALWIRQQDSHHPLQAHRPRQTLDRPESVRVGRRGGRTGPPVGPASPATSAPPSIAPLTGHRGPSRRLAR